MGPAVLSRIFVAVDLSVKALYDDNSLLLLTSSGSTFTHVDPHGNCVTQLSLYAIARFKAKLAEVIKFRNLHVEPPLALPSLQSSSYHVGYILSSVKWPFGGESAQAESQLRPQADGSIVLDSEDSAARVVLHPNASRIAVCYPLLMPSTDSSQHHYSWQTQLFSLTETPHRWHWPLHLLQQASAECKSEQQQQQQQHLPSQSRQQPVSRTTDLPTAMMPDTVLSMFPKQSWWFDCSQRLPRDIGLLLEWTPDALYQYSPHANEATAWIHADESCLQSEDQGSFLRHCKGNKQPDRLYAAEAVPVHSGSPGARYPLAAFADHVLHLRQLGASLAGCKQGKSIGNSAGDEDACDVDGSQVGLSSTIHEQHDVTDCGVFTAYGDGSVHVAFDDRTLLYLKPSHDQCDVITPDGHRTTVAAASPLGVEQYVAQAVEFADWAFSSPVERAVVLQQAANIQKELGKCQRAAALCDWARGQVTPALQAPLQPPQSLQPDSLCQVVSPEKEFSLSVLCMATQEHSSPAKREQMIQALLTKSNHLLSTLG